MKTLGFIQHSQFLIRHFSVRVQSADGLQYNVSNDLKALGTELVHRVFRRVVIDVIEAVIEIDDVGHWNADLREWLMVVFDGGVLFKEMRLCS
jgi:hypothetical protein